MINLIGFNILNKSFSKPLDNKAILQLQANTEQGGPSVIVNLSLKAKELQMETRKTDSYIDNLKEQRESYDVRMEAYRRASKL